MDAGSGWLRIIREEEKLECLETQHLTLVYIAFPTFPCDQLGSLVELEDLAYRYVVEESSSNHGTCAGMLVCSASY